MDIQRKSLLRSRQNRMLMCACAHSDPTPSYMPSPRAQHWATQPVRPMVLVQKKLQEATATVVCIRSEHRRSGKHTKRQTQLKTMQRRLRCDQELSILVNAGGWPPQAAPMVTRVAMLLQRRMSRCAVGSRVKSITPLRRWASYCDGLNTESPALVEMQ